MPNVPLRITPDGLLEFLKTHNSKTEKMFKDTLEYSIGIVDLELKYLRLFAIDYSIYRAFGDIPEKRTILNEFLVSLIGEKYFASFGSDTLKSLNDRFIKYGNSLKQGMGDPCMVGKTFSYLCCGEHDPLIAFRGAIEFNSIVNFLPDILLKKSSSGGKR
jgi:hypothetical protein